MIDYAQLVFEEPSTVLRPEKLYLATWLKVKVAVKYVRSLKDLDQDETNELIGKIKHSMGLRHPNVILMMGYSIDKDSNLLSVFEYPTIGSLFDLVKAKNMILEEDVHYRVTKSVAVVLSFFNKRKAPHGNLSASNVYVSLFLR